MIAISRPLATFDVQLWWLKRQQPVFGALWSRHCTTRQVWSPHLPLDSSYSISLSKMLPTKSDTSSLSAGWGGASGGGGRKPSPLTWIFSEQAIDPNGVPISKQVSCVASHTGGEFGGGGERTWPPVGRMMTTGLLLTIVVRLWRTALEAFFAHKGKDRNMARWQKFDAFLPTAGIASESQCLRSQQRAAKATEILMDQSQCKSRLVPFQNRAGSTLWCRCRRKVQPLTETPGLNQSSLQLLFLRLTVQTLMEFRVSKAWLLE